MNELLSADPLYLAAVHRSLIAFAPWISDNKLPFFPEFTDHGPRHISEVLATAASIITDRAWELLTSADAAALTLSVLLHDSAMHLTENGFVWLIQQTSPGLRRHNDAPWSVLWQLFLGEVSRWDERRIEDIFGHRNRPRRPPADPSSFTLDDRRLIGEFVRRHHARLAHEIAIWGLPGVSGRVPLCEGLQPPIAEIIGLIARSHNLSIRSAIDCLDPNDSRDPFGIHAPFIMAVLRIADYLQIHSERAPGALLLLRSLRSPISSSEWRTHLSVQAINNTQNDPEAIYVRAVPDSAPIFLKLRALLDSIQKELDETWAALGEVYGRFGALSDLRLGIRRVRSNIDDVSAFGEHVSYLPRHAAFASAGAELLKLLIKPLYGDWPEIGIRELVQNAVDAVRERIDLDEANGAELPRPEITVQLIRTDDSSGELVVRDCGVGMTADVIVNFFLKAGASFRRSMTWRQQHTAEDGSSRVLRSGRFGIGALAAFLLGDHIEVTTRHVSEPRGTFFSAQVDDSVIELQRVDCEVGTTIRVPLTDPSVLRRLANNPQMWDWYGCAAPEVASRIDATPVSSLYSCPTNGQNPLPANWRRTSSDDYNDVQWTYSIENRTMLFCNGIRVGQSAQIASAIHGTELLRHLERGDFKTLTVRAPSVSVFDADANLPLNLQRTALAMRRYPFHHELVTDVLSDFVAFAAVNVPHDPRELLSPFVAEQLDYPGITTKPDSTLEDVLWLWFWHTPSGLALSDPWSFDTIRPSRLVILPRLFASSIPAEMIPFERECVVPMDCLPESLKDMEPWLRWACGEQPYRLGPMGAIRTVGCRVLVTAAIMESMLSKKKKAWAAAIVSYARQLSNDWYLLERGSQEETLLDYEAIAEIQPVMRLDAIGEVTLAPRGAHAVPQSDPAKVWSRLVGSASIPYDVEARRRWIEGLPNADHVRAHRQLRAAFRPVLHVAPEPAEE